MSAFARRVPHLEDLRVARARWLCTAADCLQRPTSGRAPGLGEGGCTVYVRLRVRAACPRVRVKWVFGQKTCGRRAEAATACTATQRVE
eukprot:6344457-Prymnesium_polylepis.1